MTSAGPAGGGQHHGRPVVPAPVLTTQRAVPVGQPGIPGARPGGRLLPDPAGAPLTTGGLDQWLM